MALSEHEKQKIREEEAFRQAVRNETNTQTESYVDRKAQLDDAKGFGRMMAIPVFILIILFGAVLSEIGAFVSKLFK